MTKVDFRQSIREVLGSILDNKLLSRLPDFGREGVGGGVWANLLKRKICGENIFFRYFWMKCKSLWKMISADVEANKNKKNKKKIWWLYLTNFYKNQLQNLKYNVKKVCTYHLILVGILSILMLTVKNSTGGGFFWLNEQNLLSVAKVICRQSLNHIAINNDVDNILFVSWPLPRKLFSPVFQ